MSRNRQSNTQDNADLLATVAALRADIRKMIEKAMERTSASNEEQFLAQVMTGVCPGCGRNQIKDCRQVQGIDDITIGLCMQCGFIWCLECGRSLIGDVHCDHWDVCIKCDEVDDCDIDLKECEKLRGNI